MSFSAVMQIFESRDLLTRLYLVLSAGQMLTKRTSVLSYTSRVLARCSKLEEWEVQAIRAMDEARSCNAELAQLEDAFRGPLAEVAQYEVCNGPPARYRTAPVAELTPLGFQMLERVLRIVQTIALAEEREINTSLTMAEKEAEINDEEATVPAAVLEQGNRALRRKRRELRLLETSTAMIQAVLPCVQRHYALRVWQQIPAMMSNQLLFPSDDPSAEFRRLAELRDLADPEEEEQSCVFDGQPVRRWNALFDLEACDDSPSTFF